MQSGRSPCACRLTDFRCRFCFAVGHPPCAQDFGAESLNLVERLFADLVLSTRSYQELERQNKDLQNIAEQKEMMMLPLKKKNLDLNSEHEIEREN